MVYVISKEGKPLMPTKRHGKVRRLLKQGLAKVVRSEPFTIQLLYDTTTYTQPVIVGVDIGSKTEGWLAPSVEWKVDAHVRLVNLVAKILPVAKIVVEIAPFDIHKVVNPDVEGSQYQEGPQKDFCDVREYCLWRAGYKSELSVKRGILEVHHIIPISEGGTDNPSNLIVLTAEEHKAVHDGMIKIPRSRLEKIKILKDASHVSTIGWYISSRLKQQYKVEVTFGSKTKDRRIELGLEKSHRNDAFVIAGGNNNIKRLDYWYYGKFFRRQNRSLHKVNPVKGGIRPANTIKEVKGFRRFDKVRYKNMVGIIYGLRSTGYFDIRTLNGDKIHSSAKWQDLKLIEKAKTLMFERREGCIPLHLTEDGVSCVQQ
ncbi:MAG TPA: RRXRR domain-containing protein [Pseudothermotoga sp.]